MLSSARLLLPVLPVGVVQQQLENAGFDTELALPGGPLGVTCPASWPGDTLPSFPLRLKPGGCTGRFVLMDRSLALAVGLTGSKGSFNEQGDLGTSYDLNLEYQGSATEALQALLHWQPPQARAASPPERRSLTSPVAVWWKSAVLRRWAGTRMTTTARCFCGLPTS